MTKLKTVDIKGKKYVEVNTRLKYFRDNYKGWSLTSKVVEHIDGKIIIRAEIKDENDRVIATGIAYEQEGSSFINKTSYIENCETSAWGRALGNLGIGLDTSVASYEEVSNAIINQKPSQNAKISPTKQATPVDTKKLEIKRLCDEFDPLLSENKGYAKFVKSVVDLDLEEKNYEEIINRLIAKKGEK